MKACIDDNYRKNLILPYNLQWFADGEGGEKTEPATQKKLDDARKEGKVAKSKDLTQGIDLLVLFLLLKIFASFNGSSPLKPVTEISTIKVLLKTTGTTYSATPQ